MNSSDIGYEGWDTESHVQTFDIWNKMSDLEFKYSYGSFAEQKYLRAKALSKTTPKILDVGCATGTTFRFLSTFLKPSQFEYLGVDLSQPAIDRARHLHPKGNFKKKQHENLTDFVGGKYPLVFSRDTVLHQTDPFAFLNELLNVTDETLILRLRTREQGETVLDLEQSCQMHYDQYWMPYIVINTDELVTFLKANPRVSKVTLNRSFEVLGGHNFRYLPKDLYFKATGTAETSMMIELSDNAASGEADIIFDDTLQGHAFLRKNRYQRYAFAAWSKLLGKR